MLCDLCQTITFQSRTSWTGDIISKVTSYISNHQPDLQSLQDPASHGCHFCTLLWDRLSRPPSRVINPLGRSKPKPPNPESEAVQLYYETSEYGKTPEAIFAYSGPERSVAFEVLELESTSTVSFSFMQHLYSRYQNGREDPDGLNESS